MSEAPSLQGQDEAAALMARIGEGDHDAFDVLVRRFSGRMFSLAHHMMGATGEAEEIVQEICLRLWQRPGVWRPEGGSFKSWLDRVIVNACLDRLRRRKWHGGAVDENWQDPQPDVVARLVKQEEQEAVRQAILQLPPRQRAALLLVEYRGLRQDAAAKDMGLSVEALESLLARGRRKLRALLAPVIGAKEVRHAAG